MSEPYSAFIKLRMTRPKLVGWLNARPPSASMWTDWRSLYLGGRQDLKNISADQLSEIIATVIVSPFPQTVLHCRTLLSSRKPCGLRCTTLVLGSLSSVR
jgi:hypothetical protein